MIKRRDVGTISGGQYGELTKVTYSRIVRMSLEALTATPKNIDDDDMSRLGL